MSRNIFFLGGSIPKYPYAPIRRTVPYLEAGKLVFHHKVRIMCVNYNEYGDNHHGTR